LIAIYGALTYSRFVFLAGILLCPMLAIDLAGALGKRESSPGRAGMNAVTLLALVACVVWLNPSNAVLHEGIVATYPEQALPRLQQLPANARVLNAYEWGGYLMWNLPQLPLFIDGRTDIFVHEGIMQDYAQALEGDHAFEVLDKYRIDDVLLPKEGSLPDLLAHDPGWKLAYQDRNALLFERIAATPRQ
jgi:hypothetical protein